MKSNISLQEAINLMLGHAAATKNARKSHLFELYGKILATNLTVRKSLPAFDNSAMDGYAIKLCDAGKSIPIGGTILAGDTGKIALKAGECYKVMTGAPIPVGTEAVVPFENARLSGGIVKIPKEIKQGANIKRAGEELGAGEELFSAGEELGSYQIALLASQGYSVIPTYAPLRIALYSSGNELIEPWEHAQAHQIYNANASMLLGTLKHFGFSADYLGVLPDNLEAMSRAVALFEHYDAVITSGGVSAGEADFMEQVLKNAGMRTIFHGVNVKPGHPMMMGILNKTILLCLPGNPLSAALNLYFLGIPMLRKLQGNKAYHLEYVCAENKESISLKGNRANMILGRLEEGRFLAHHGGKYGSGMLTPLAQSNALIFCAQGRSEIAAGERVKVIPYNCNFSPKESNIFN